MLHSSSVRIAASLSWISLASAQQPLVPHFVDVTASAGISCGYLPGANFGQGAMNTSPMGAGVGLADFDGDGWPDIYVVTGGALPDQLLRNNADGTFTDVASAAGMGTPHMGLGCCVGDYDGDGRADLFITSRGTASGPPLPGQFQLWHNEGGMVFTEVAASAGIAYGSLTDADGMGSCFGDYDRDGDLDLFVTGWIPNSRGNRLYRNDGNGVFADVTVAAGLHGPAIRGFSPNFVDMDGDRWPELLVAADFGTSRYFVNQGDGTFGDQTSASGTGLDGNGMGHCVGDFDGDGLLDWYVTSIFTLFPPVNVVGSGNMLYRNLGGHQYGEVAAVSGVNDGGWGWGALAVDVNNDGGLDLVETNGFKALNSIGQSEWLFEPCYLWLNDGSGHFVESGSIAHFDNQGAGRGLASLDYDRDGDLDLVLALHKGRLRLFRNDSTPADDHWLRVVLDTQASDQLAPCGVGSLLRLTAGGRELVRVIDAGASYMSTSELVAHFGLRGLERVTRLKIEWTNGRDTWIENPAVDQTLTVRYCPADWNGRDQLDASDIRDFQADWLAGNADFDLDGDTDVADRLAFLSAYEAGCP